MASELPASSSSLQQFANPQPAAVPAISQATSPPTKQSLKSWWKGFRPPNKSHENPGKHLSFRKTSYSQMCFSSDNFAYRVTTNRGRHFQDITMDRSASRVDGLLLEDASRACSIRQTSHRNQRISFQDARHRIIYNPQPSNSIFASNCNPT